MAGGFEGANRMDRALTTWIPNMGSADAQLLDVKDELDAKANDLTHNDSYTAGAADKWRDSIVGSHYKLNSKPDYGYLSLTAEWAQEFADEVESKFNLWGDSGNHWVDASGMNTFTGLVRLAIGGQAFSHGEVLATAEWIRDGRQINTAIQMIDPTRLSNPNGRPDSLTLRGGRKRNKWGRATSYFIRQGHPHDLYSDYRQMTWKEVAARKPWGRQQVIHLLEQQRVDQSRGFAALVTALKTIRTRRKLSDVELQNVSLNAMYAAALETDLPPEVAAAVLGGDTDSNGDSAAYGQLVNQLANYFGDKSVMLDGVKVPVLPPGTKLKMQRAAAQANSQFSFENSLLRSEARAAGLSFEEYTGDYTQTNMASARAASGETWKTMLGRKAMLADPFANSIFALWLEESISKGLIESLPKNFNVAAFYQGHNKEALCKCRWLGAAKPVVNPKDEALAERMLQEDGAMTYEERYAKKGQDWREGMDQLKREQDYANSIGLALPGPDDKSSQANKSRGQEDDDENNNASAGEPADE